MSNQVIYSWGENSSPWIQTIVIFLKCCSFLQRPVVKLKQSSCEWPRFVSVKVFHSQMYRWEGRIWNVCEGRWNNDSLKLLKPQTGRSPLFHDKTSKLQGESNICFQTDFYSCIFSSLISRMGTSLIINSKTRHNKKCFLGVFNVGFFLMTTEI